MTIGLATSTAIVLYNPHQPFLQVRARLKELQNLYGERAYRGHPILPLSQVTVLLTRIQQLFIAKSFQAQIADAQKLHSVPLYASLINGKALPVKIDLTPSKPFSGTRSELLSLIENTVHETIERLDFNGLWPYLKIIDEGKKGKSLEEITIDSSQETGGTTCMGMSHHLLRNLKEKHGVEGMLAVVRQSAADPFSHGSVIIECSDGYVLLETKSNPNMRIYSIPFESTVRYDDWALTASKPGSLIPLTVKCKKTEKIPKMSFEYCTRVANGNDLVMKFYVATKISSYVPIVLFNTNGSTSKYLKLYTNERRIEFLQNNKDIIDVIPFDAVFNEEFRKRLIDFMNPHSISTIHFHISAEIVHQQVLQFVSGIRIVKDLLGG